MLVIHFELTCIGSNKDLFHSAAYLGSWFILRSYGSEIEALRIDSEMHTLKIEGSVWVACIKAF